MTHAHVCTTPGRQFGLWVASVSDLMQGKMILDDVGGLSVQRRRYFVALSRSHFGMPQDPATAAMESETIRPIIDKVQAPQIVEERRYEIGFHVYSPF